MKKILWSNLFAVALFCFGCEKKEDPNKNEEKEKSLEIVAADTLYLAHDTTFTFQVQAVASDQLELIAKISSLPTSLKVDHTDAIFMPNDYGRFELKFDQFDVRPDVYFFDLLLSYTNINFEAIQKRVYVVYDPTCAYEYRAYVNGSITYNINQELVNKTIWCNYSSEGNLLVNNLTPYPMEWVIDCTNQTFTMKPITYQGIYKTLTGKIIGNELHYTLLDNGIESATGVVRP